MQPLKHRVRDTLLPVAAHLSRSGPQASEPTDTLLVIQPDHLGDVLLSQPAVRYLRDAFPSTRLVGVVGPWSRRIAELSWPVDALHTVEFPGFDRDGPLGGVRPYRRLRDESRRLAPFAASTAVVLRPDAWWSAWLAHASGIRRIVTGDDPRLSAFATTRAVVPPDAHAAARALAIARAAVGVGPDGSVRPSQAPLYLPLLDDASRAVATMLADAGVQTGRGYVVIHPGAGVPVKQWPAHRWTSIARALHAAGVGVVLTGSTAEAELTREIARDTPRALDLAGQTTIDELVELLRGAALVIGPDCGPLHMAVATHTPTVHVFGPSDPVRYGPWGTAYQHLVVRAGWSCPRCGDLSANREAGCGCMLAVRAAAVQATAEQLLGIHAAA
jgi:heptosyltransferase-2/heptosyltransferase-3